jgi:hypothetical protein
MVYSVPIFLINLDSRLDRLADSQIQAKKNNFKFIRVPAITPPESLPDGTLISPPAYACLQSHLMSLKAFLSTEHSHALILEDDFAVTNNRAFAKFLNYQSYKHFDFVQLGFLQMGIRHRLDLINLQIENGFLRFLGFILRLSPDSSQSKRLRIRRRIGVPFGFIPDDIRSGAHCYVISRKLAEVVLRLNDPAFLTIDSLYGSLTWNHQFKMIRTSNSWVKQTNSQSSIKVQN